jgi:hypothetical protein
MDAGSAGGAALPYARRLAARLDIEASSLGYDRPGSIPEAMTFLDWCNDLATKGMKIDRKPFKLSDRPALVPIYQAIPRTRREAWQKVLTIQKATQLGLTVWEVLADIYMAKKWSPVNIGLFLPEATLAAFKSERRFMPIIRSVPELHREMMVRVNDDGSVQNIGEGNVLTREFGNSLLMFLWTSGKVTTESRPMDIVSLDEVQGMALDDIDKVRNRVGDSDVQFTMLLSTAHMPDLDINAWYKRGTQEVWHTRCESCGALSDLSDPDGIFPTRSVAYNTGQVKVGKLPPNMPAGRSAPEKDDYVWLCPRCQCWLPDPQHGEYVPQNPSAGQHRRSFLLPRTVSPRTSPRLLFEEFNAANTGDQRKTFYNRALARPYIDADQLPVTLAVLQRCVEVGKQHGVVWKDSGRDTLMGIDQMGGWNAVIIKERLPTGHQAVIHVEAIFGDDPFARCSTLMQQYGVAVCVVEQLPNVNDARRFANKHRGRVFLASYGLQGGADMMVWGDAATRSDRKTSEEDRSQYAVNLQQYKAMQAALYRLRDTLCLFPDPMGLEQEVIEKGVTKRVPLLRDWVFYHFTKTALVVEQDKETRKPKPRVMKVGIDPHFSYANMLCDVAWARSHGTAQFILPQNPAEAPKSDVAAQVERNMPGLPASIVAMMDALPPGICGRCISFKEGHCTFRYLKVGAADLGCTLYEAIDQ